MICSHTRSFPVTNSCIYADTLDEQMSLFNPKALDSSSILVAPIFEVINFSHISVFPPSNSIALVLLYPLHITLWNLYLHFPHIEDPAHMLKVKEYTKKDTKTLIQLQEVPPYTSLNFFTKLSDVIMRIILLINADPNSNTTFFFLTWN